MSFATSLRTAVPLLIGLAIGGVGVALFHDSLPGAEGSPEERASKLEVELKNARNHIAALEDTRPRRMPKGGGFGDGARRLVEDAKAGKNINPDDIFDAMKPFYRDFAPVFERMQVMQEKRHIASKVGELARKYDLSPEQQKRLTAMMTQKASDDAKRWSELMGSPGTTTEDMARESMNRNVAGGIDPMMESMLSGDKLADYKTTRMTERAERVQQRADLHVQRLNGIVELDETQRDQVFGIFARSSPDYDPGMKLEGIGGDIATTPGGNSRDAMLSVLRADQREKYEAERDRRRADAEREMNEIGFTLPANWDLLDQADY